MTDRTKEHVEGRHRAHRDGGKLPREERPEKGLFE
jgi:hypothetical protein